MFHGNVTATTNLLFDLPPCSLSLQPPYTLYHQCHAAICRHHHATPALAAPPLLRPHHLDPSDPPGPPLSLSLPAPPQRTLPPPLSLARRLVASDPLSLLSFARAVSAVRIPSDPASPSPPPPDPSDPPPLLPLPCMHSLGPLDPAQTPLSLTCT